MRKLILFIIIVVASACLASLSYYIDIFLIAKWGMETFLAIKEFIVSFIIAVILTILAIKHGRLVR